MNLGTIMNRGYARTFSSKVTRPSRWIRIPRATSVWVGLALAALAVSAPDTLAQELTVESIFGSATFTPERMPVTRWTPDGTRFTFVVGRDGSDVTDLVAEDVETGQRTTLIDGFTLVPPGERGAVPIEGYDWSPDGSMLLIYTRTQRVWRRNTKGIYFVYDIASASLRPVSTGFGWQQFAKFSPDNRKVGFVRDNNVFVVDLATGRETQLTDDGSDNVINGTFDWVYEEELSLQDGWLWSPDSRRIAFWRLDQTAIKSFFMIDDLQLYPRPVPVRYPKAGEANSVALIGVLDVESGETHWMDTGDNPDVYLARMQWAESSGEVVIQRLNRHQNRIDVLMADAATGESRVLFQEASETWVDMDDHFTWLNGGEQFLWSSDRDGFEHLYLYNRDGSLARQLTHGDWDVRGVNGVGADDEWVYFTASMETPIAREIYRVSVDGGAPQKISEGSGTHSMNLGPGAHFYIGTHTQAGSPATIGLFTGEGRPVRGLVDNSQLNARLAAARMLPTEFFSFETTGGVELNGSMIRPPDFDESRAYPVLMYVYGGPGSQRVTDAWGGNRFLWHQMMAQRGYIVAIVDNRGTGGRGRDFQKMTYQNLGDTESNDQVEAARYLGSLPYVDADRIGIWGWSYGGYMTLMSMMRGGDVFRAGISVAPVTSWEFYDTIYTERFMRTPRENPEGYRRSAPMEHVEGLTGDLLLVHGTGDDNVHFQNSVQVIDRLQEAGKQFNLMIYPNRTHSIGGVVSQTHLYEMMTRFVEEKLGSASGRPIS